MPLVFTNGAASTLTTAVNSTDTAPININVSSGASFPSVASGSSDYFYLALVDSTGSYEIFKITQVSGNVLVASERSVDGTTAMSFVVGDRAELRLVASAMSNLVQRDENIVITKDSPVVTLKDTVSPCVAVFRAMDSSGVVRGRVEYTESTTVPANSFVAIRALDSSSVSGSTVEAYEDGWVGLYNKKVPSKVEVLSDGRIKLVTKAGSVCTIDVGSSGSLSLTGSLTINSSQSVSTVSTSTSLGTSNSALSTQNAIKTYVDNQIATVKSSFAFHGGATSSSSAGASMYYHPNNGYSAGALSELSKGVVAVSGTLKNFYFKASSNTADNSSSVYLLVNGVAAASLSIAAGSTASASDTTSSYAVSAGDSVTIQVAQGVGSGSLGYLSWGFTVEQ